MLICNGMNLFNFNFLIAVGMSFHCEVCLQLNCRLFHLPKHLILLDNMFLSRNIKERRF
jgi:hypothetical protein